MAPGAPKTRFDLGTLRPARMMADGRLRADAHITRAGIFEYLDDRGRIRKELRPPEEVFHPDSLASFEQVPVTNEHPSVGLLSSKTAKDFMVGSTGEKVVKDDDHVRTAVMVADADTIREMKAGKVEISCGYTCDVDDTPGNHPVYGHYDAVQKNIRGNHVAIVDSARAGKSARVRLDSNAMRMVARDERLNAEARDNSTGFGQRQDAAPQRRGDQMDPDKLQETIRALGAQLTEAKERADGAHGQLKEAQVRADVAEGKLLTAEARISELQTQVASHASATQTEAMQREKERADAAEAKVARFDATIEKRVRERAKLERQAFSVMGSDFRMDDLADREIMASVVKRLDSTADVGKSVSDGIIQGRFLSLLDGYNKNAISQARVAEVLADTQNDSPRLDAKTQKQQKLRDQWKQPLPNDIHARRAGKD